MNRKTWHHSKVITIDSSLVINCNVCQALIRKNLSTTTPFCRKIWPCTPLPEFPSDVPDCNERLLATINKRKMSFVGHVLRRKDISCDLFMGSVMETEAEVDRKRDTVTTLGKELELKVL